MLALLNHPNIIVVYDVGQDNERSYIVSELVDGESLRSIIDHGDHGPVQRGANFFERALQVNLG